MAVVFCKGCRQRDREIEQLKARLSKVEAELARVLGRNAGNSSMPPSAQPPGAAKPVVKEETGNKPGGQPGHLPCHRVRLPAERVQHTVHHLPAACAFCQHPLPAEAGANDPEPTWHQTAELPQVLADVTEHLGHARTCPHCAKVTQAVIPADIRAHIFGPRLTAGIAYITGGLHLSKRDAETTVETLFGVPVSLGKISAVEQEVSAALAEPYAEAGQAVVAAASKNVDETSWKRRGKLAWLWVAVTQACSYFLIHKHRSAAAFHQLLNEALPGIVTSDRWVVYNELDVYQRQLFAENIFNDWYRVRDGTLQRSTLMNYINRQRPWLRNLLEQGSGCGCAKTAALCRNLLALEPALWTFARVEGVEPTNNAAERALRRAVLWRKRSFGCHSDAGCRYVERMLTVIQTLRAQQRGVLDYLAAAVTALRQAAPAPRLLGLG